MPTYGQGAPGTRVRLRDQSGVSLVKDPRITGGVVGFSSNGEFNTIIDITSTADMDTILGAGFNSSRYNQALYASRALINAGAYCEFVRVYGEEIVTDDSDLDAYNNGQELKTDTFLVQYDFSTDATDSFDIDHFASTRYIQDGLTGIGEREIYTIAEVLTKNTPRNFVINSDETATDKIPLFAIMNTDPTSATRAGDKVDISNIVCTDGSVVTITTLNVHGFSVGDVVVVAGTVNFNGTATIVTTPTTTTCTYAIGSGVNVGNGAVANESVGAVFINEDTATSGADAITVKTVAAGQTSKKFEYLRLADVGTPGDYDLNNRVIGFIKPDGNAVYFEMTNDDNTETGNTAVTITEAQFTTTDVSVSANSITVLSAASYFAVGDVVRFVEYDGSSIPSGIVDYDHYETNYIVSGISGNAMTFNDTDGDQMNIEDTGSGTNKIVNMTETLRNIRLAMVAEGISGDSFVRGVFNGVTGVSTNVATNNVITVDNAGKFAVGDDVMISDLHNERGTVSLPTGMTTRTFDTVAAIDLEADTVTLTNLAVTADVDSANKYTQTITDVEDIGDLLTFDGTDGDASKFQVDDVVLYTANGDTIAGLTDGTTYMVESSQSRFNEKITLKTVGGVSVPITADSSQTAATLTNVTAREAANFRLTNLTQSNGGSCAISSGNSGVQLDYMGVFGLNIPVDTQENSSFFDLSDANYPAEDAFQSSYTDDPTNDVYGKITTTTDDGIVMDSTVGRTFMNLGLATEEYIDTDFDGTKERIYKLTTDGEAVAAIYLYVEYIFRGDTYLFSGTIIPYAVGETNYYIGNSADRVSLNKGWQFVINESIALESATADTKFDMSQSVSSSLIQSEYEQVSFNASDPAILNDVIWTYNPANNQSSSALSNAWQLFLNKDEASADMLVSAGTTISNLFMRGLEEINFTVMDGMLDICEKRKDLFCVFDGVDESDIDVALDKMSGAGNQGDVARWGGIFDGRSIFNDTVYTKLSVEAVKSIEVAAIIAINRSGSSWWLAPAGYDTGKIPGALASKQKYVRTYNYADDPTSDIARLYDANINPTRVNNQGQVIYGQKTMLKRLTALSRMNVIMLIAGIHKRFANYLDTKVFQLNTPGLRSNIQAELQSTIDGILSANPPGLTAGTVICDESNNTPEIIDTNQLIVDLIIQPTRTAEYITLRTTVQRTGEELNLTDLTIIGG